ncbi:prepilin-type N-terminal cleavage/methylation domain-containing protein [Puniceicoccaceae bacterium K14]|nr:prepilin-type N-terminal cleavage/methylation domain-containing protein [Puniceicoccaceae bacterium K14]
MHTNKSKKGFTLVEIMIVVVIIGLLAAMAIPAFDKVRENSRHSAMDNDARQLASAAQQYMLENGVDSATITYSDSDGAITGDLSAYVRQIGTGYTGLTGDTITTTTGFTFGHALAAGDRDYTAEGQKD